MAQRISQLRGRYATLTCSQLGQRALLVLLALQEELVGIDSVLASYQRHAVARFVTLLDQSQLLLR